MTGVGSGTMFLVLSEMGGGLSRLRAAYLRAVSASASVTFPLILRLLRCGVRPEVGAYDCDLAGPIRVVYASHLVCLRWGVVGVLVVSCHPISFDRSPAVATGGASWHRGVMAGIVAVVRAAMVIGEVSPARILTATVASGTPTYLTQLLLRDSVGVREVRLAWSRTSGASVFRK